MQREGRFLHFLKLAQRQVHWTGMRLTHTDQHRGPSTELHSEAVWTSYHHKRLTQKQVKTYRQISMDPKNRLLSNSQEGRKKQRSEN